MAENKRIQDLPPITADQSANNDVLPIVDVTAFETKKIRIDELKKKMSEDSQPKLPSGSDGQVLALESGVPAWIDPPSTGGSWGDITGDITEQTDLMSEFESRDNAISDINNSISEIDNDISNINDELDNKAPAFSVAQNKIVLGGDTAGTIKSSPLTTTSTVDTTTIQNDLSNLEIKSTNLKIESNTELAGEIKIPSGAQDGYVLTSNDNGIASWKKSGQGGLVVASLFDRDAIPTEDRFDGLHVYVEDIGRNYQLRGGITNDDWFEEITLNSEEYGQATSPFVGTDGDNPGIQGLVPVPQNSDVGKVLSAEGEWRSTKESLDEIFAFRAFEDVDTQWSTNTPIRGTLTKETADPLSGNASYKFVVGTFGGIRYSPVVKVDKRFRGNTATLYFPYTYDGNSTTLKIHLIGNPAGAPIEIIPNDIFVQGSNGGNAIYKINVTIPNNVTDICFALETFATDVGKVFNFGDIRLTTDKTIYANIANITPWVNMGPIAFSSTGTPPQKPTNPANIIYDQVRVRNVGENVEAEYIYYTIAAGANAGSGDLLLPAPVPFDSSVPRSTAAMTNYPSGSVMAQIDSNGFIYNNTTGTGYLVAYAYNDNYFRVRADNLYTQNQTMTSGFFQFTNIVQMKITIKYKGRGLVSQSPTIVLANETFNSDVATFRFRSSADATLATLPNGNIGDYITWNYGSGGNILTQNTVRPTQTDADMSINGVRIFAIPHDAASTAAQPTRIAINIGKGFKGSGASFLTMFKSTGKPPEMANIDYDGIGNVELGLSFKSYNERTGILILDAGYSVTAASTSRTFAFSDATTQTDGYLVINASKSPALSGVPHPKRYIVATYESGTDQGWYEVYNDGWVVQGHTQNVGTGAALKTVTPLISLRTGTKPRYFSFMTAGNGVAGTAEANQVYSEGSTTATSFAFYNNVTPSLPFIIWEAKGYGDSAAVKALGATPNY